MKKFFIYALCALTLSTTATSCLNHDDERIFDESSAQRINTTVAEVNTLLQKAEYGWAIDFYPYNTSWGGYAFAATFEGTKTTMYSEISMRDELIGRDYPVGTGITSLYEVKGEQSVVLTFNTYNLLFHYWSEPISDDSPSGYMSDYEFMVMKISADEIVLRGKKYGNTMRMTRLDMPAADYIKATADNHSRMKQIPRQRLMAGTRRVPMTVDGTVITLATADDNGQTTIPFTYTANGLRFYEPVVIDGVEMLEFRLDEADNLISTSSTASIPYPSPAEIFSGAASPWYFDYYLTAGEFDMCDSLRELLLEANAQAQAWTYANKLVAMTFGKSISHSKGMSGYEECIGWESMQFRRYEPLYVGYDATFSAIDDNTIGITPIGPGAYMTPGGTPDFNTVLMPLADYFVAKAPYRITDATTERLRLESVADAECWFTLTIDNPKHWFD